MTIWDYEITAKAHQTEVIEMEISAEDISIAESRREQSLLSENCLLAVSIKRQLGVTCRVGVGCSCVNVGKNTDLEYKSYELDSRGYQLRRAFDNMWKVEAGSKFSIKRRS